MTEVVSPRLLFCAGLLVAAAANLVFIIKPDAVLLLSICWGLNGLAQGVGWPALSAILIAWFPAKTRGTVWGMLTLSGNVATTLSPILLTQVMALAVHMGAAHAWHWVFIISAGAAAAASAACFACIPSDAPPDAGQKEAAKPGGTSPPVSWRSALWSWRLWLVVVADGVTYMILKGLSDWTMGWLTHTRGASPALAAFGGWGEKKITKQGWWWQCVRALAIYFFPSSSFPV